jgi:hypothetical protein
VGSTRGNAVSAAGNKLEVLAARARAHGGFASLDLEEADQLRVFLALYYKKQMTKFKSIE